MRISLPPQLRQLLFMSALCLFGALRAQADCNTPRLIRSAQNGNFNTGSTWVGGIVPTSCDFVVIDHTVALDGSFTIGQNGTGGLTVNNGGSLSGSQALSITGNAAYTLTNNGTLNINALNFNGTGATFTNNATATLNGDQTWNSGSYLENKGYLTVTGNITQADGTLRNDAIYGTLTVGGTVTLNGATRWDNTGRIVSNSNGTTYAFYLQGSGSSFYNRPTGRLKMPNGGLYQAGSTTINNENYIGVLNLETHDGALMMNTDSVMVGGNFINGDIFSNYAGANIRIGANFTQINKTNSILSNDGFVQITGNFSNDKAIGGNGGGYTIGGTSTNTSNGQVTGSVDICDASVSGNNANGYPLIFDVNNNSNQGSNYGVSTSATRCQYVATTASLYAGNITGNGEVCAGSTTNTYSVPAVSGATSYVWTVPSGYTITATSPAGTIAGGGTTATINTTASTGLVSITVTAGSAAGVITLKTIGATAAAYNYTSKLVKMSGGTPGTPGAITGPGAAVCAGSGGFVFSIAPVSGASTYTWTVPSGWTINYGQGTTSISATASATGGTVTVTAGNACGNSVAASYTVTPPAALTAPAISGPASACQNSSQNYTASAVSGASGYRWTVPSGWIIQTQPTAGLYPATINVTVGTTSGNVTATAINNCGTGPSASYAVAVGQTLNTPQFAASSGTTNSTAPCANNAGYTYTIVAQTGALYNWTLPSGWVVTTPTGISGTTFSTSTNSITVTPGSTGGTITVTLTGTCNSSPTQNTQLNVAPLAQPAAPSISSAGGGSFCGGVAKTFTISTLPAGNNVTWAVPAGWTIDSGQGTTSISATPGTAAVAGNVTATLTNSNGCNSPAATYAVMSGATMPGAITGQAIPTASNTGLVYKITAVSGATSYNWTVPTGWTITGTSPAITGTYGGTTLNGTTATGITVNTGTAGGTVSVSANNGTCTSAASTKAVDINQPTVYTASAYSVAKKTTCYATGDVLYTATDGNGAITNAVISAGSLPAGLSLANDGTISVSNPANLPIGTAPSFTVTTTDAASGQTTKTFSTGNSNALVFNADQAATQAGGAYRVLENYTNGDVLTTYSDPDGAIASLVLTNGTLPPGTALQLSGNNGVLAVTDRTKLSPGTYTFTVATSNTGCTIGLSSLTTTVNLGNSKALPVELTYFTGQAVAAGVQLTWGTAQEQNCLRFEVQRSADGLAFATIGEVAGAGSSSVAHTYRFTDSQPLADKPTAYYRLRQVDFDGTSHYSPVLAFSATAKAARLTLELAPNPVRETLRVQLAGTTGMQELAVYAVSGKLMLRQTVEATATLPVQQLPAGMYLLQVRAADGQTLTRRFVKE
ncbi:T9SS type A sorting domain-containing protein [Hymenobacter properus]|uniref:T9SS type A sorting domain-containing protein n=1 Tax=Hymenobacter properus TaxID=2791026 RepID=A0A931BJN4_9BACT|nr:T9SS type A sorting domain-containing protein [Hymenobacter properus]MBF9142721.1 T9SS type A sorting domain-containing protein [Hymenobacter properus]MBR7721529.1 T9SS type A sorting domain-containing protein [Microvirga sp. SRT04]